MPITIADPDADFAFPAGPAVVEDCDGEVILEVGLDDDPDEEQLTSTTDTAIVATT